MRSIICEQPGVFKWAEVELPKPKKGNSIVNIKRIGICGTDLHAFAGNQPFFEYPRRLGHELAGVVDSTEKTSSALQKGDQVAIIPYMECGDCMVCRKGMPNCCANLRVLGVHFDGGMCEQISVPDDHLIQTNGLTLDEAAILEPLSIGAHAVRRSELKEGETVLVVGAGPIGLGVMSIAEQKGAKVIAMDINEERLRFSREWAKADEVVHAKHNPVEQLKEITNGDMPSIVFDATGNSKSMEQTFHYPANGGKLVYVGLVKDNIAFADPLFHAKELTLLASRNATRADFELVKEAIQDGRINADRYITHRAGFDGLIGEFENWLKPENGVVKAMVEL
ncbi:zinc-binding alcohol dehydrogenase family protein [Sediminibacillus massiliensis]|uniref:zinc-binding alcohol dehydrogenase family protein n=1 Tax=Sediminibacillus massiliensis TaxID=1926277 RepID=UPI0009884451|nr:zinc-binding alcohol dehydrogenase family protein [Sediminibacillus massiliensis]